ncbi:hypothetical protein ABMA28_001405 [Loxostege sticticalis]|uniref:FLYWCH-type domain-containing protein n=1 Tax=Loxostege sticticalis TaxID=481309 RepID=A0ABD0T1S1_LOXSC
MYKNYSFSYRGPRRQRLVCSRYFRGKCTAQLVTAEDGTVLILLRLTTVDGKTVFMFRGYTFSFLRPSIRILRCSRMFRGKCEVRLRILPNTLDVIQISHEHNHPPPNGIITPGGLYLRK